MNRMIDVKPDFQARARVRSLDEYHTMYTRSIEEPDAFWGEEAANLQWFYPPYHVVEESGDGEFSWFGGGKLNVAVNCVDRHAAATPDRAAFIWAKNEPGEYETITFADLKRRVGRMANALRAIGVQRGDRVCVYLPMIPELPVVMLACARIGAIHSVVFAGFSATALRSRIEDAGARVVITADGSYRGAKTIDLKGITDEAVEGLDDLVTHVLVARRTGEDITMVEGRDQWLGELCATQRATCPAEWMDAEDPLFILYTSGSTGRPKGLVHTTAGYLLYTSVTHRYVFDAREDDVYFCAADIGWITGHSYIVYGPLCNGVTCVLFESTPTYPDASRTWNVVDDLGATISLHLAHGAARADARGR